ncbi:MAG: hypothetical protein J2P58_07715, partial [Acidimicrobiaceae bacterium]|nr:hypothetical protein [Acidimicrobiaceae bacterium]
MLLNSPPTDTVVPGVGIPARLRLRRLARSPAAWLGVVIVAAQIPYLAGLFDPDPLLRLSGLGVDVTPGALPGSFTLDPNAGYTSQALAHRAALDWLHGQAPWWNPFEGIGSPLVGEMQSAALFPFVLLLAFANGQLVLYLLLSLIAGYSTYFLLRRLGLPGWACLVGGAVFGLNGTFAWMRFAPANPVCFLPLLLLGIEVVRSRARDRRRTHWWVVAVAVGLSLLAGFPETAYLNGLLALIWAGVRLGGLSGQARRRYALALAGGAACGLALAAPLLVAVGDYLPSAFLGPNGSNLTTAHVPAHGIATLLFPYVFGPLWMDSAGQIGSITGNVWGQVGGYLTAALVLLAVIGTLGREHRGLKVTLALWSLLLVARSYGVGPLEHLLGALPGMSHVLASRYMNPSLSMAVAVLAAFGVADLLEGRVSRRSGAVAVAVVAMACLLAARGARDVSAPLREIHSAQTGAILWGFFSLAVLAGVILVGRPRRLASVVLVGLLPLEAMGMFVIPELSAPTGGRVDTALVTFLRNHVGEQRFATLGPFRPNYGSYFGVASLNENDLPVPKPFARLVRRHLDPRINPVFFTGTVTNRRGLTAAAAFGREVAYYEALGVKYLLVRPGQAPPTARHATLRPVYADSTAFVYELPRPAPFFADHTRGCVLEPLSLDAVRVSCTRASTLVRNELELPGWSATVGRQVARIGVTRLSQEVVAVPAGVQTVMFVYRPAHIDLGWLAAVLGLVAVAWSAGLFRLLLPAGLRPQTPNRRGRGGGGPWPWRPRSPGRR